MEYADFIAELRPLAAEVETLLGSEFHHERPEFRRWRHEVTSLVSQMKERGFSIQCNIGERLFRPNFSPATESAMYKWYSRDLMDTFNEIDILIKRYEKYGAPKGPKQPEASERPKEELELPPSITLAWLFKHAPLRLWLWLAALVFAVFMLGVRFGHTALYGKLLESAPASSTRR